MTTAEARRRLDEAGALDRDVLLPAPLPYPRERLHQQWEAMVRVFEPTVEKLRANPSVAGELSLPEGAVVDRFGTFDGFLLHLAGTPFAARSLPPDALEPRA
jgi:hypothetical protein